MSSEANRDPRRVVLFAYDGVQPVDLVGPHEVFAGASTFVAASIPGATPYELITAGITDDPVRAESGLRLLVDTTLAAVAADRRPIDTLFIPGGDGVYPASDDPLVLDAIRAVAARSRRVATACTGAFIAAAAGLADGRRVATHWARAGRLARRFPAVMVDPDAIWLRDGSLWTSAGVTAGMDLALAMVEDDLGAAAAQEVARWLVMFLRRPGGQSQFAAPIWRPAAGHPAVREAQDLIARDPAADHRVDLLARRVGMSARHFTRTFTTELGEPPGRYVERVRVETGRAMLEATDEALPGIARRSGFHSPETFRRAFLRAFGVPPDTYRRRFRLG